MTELAPPTSLRLLLAVLTVLLAACGDEPPRSVSEFIEKPLLLEAAVVRCAQNREETRYDPECVNAREAAIIIEAREEAERRADLEAESERKRKALRRTQQAAAEARRRAEEERRLREEEAYLAQFATQPTDEAPADVQQGNRLTIVPSGLAAPGTPPGEPLDEPGSSNLSPALGSNAPVAGLESGADDSTDLDAIRDELRRRREREGS